MRLTAATISRLAADAGFVRPDLHTATALALAVSGGLDRYEHRLGLPGCGHYVGVWAIDADRWPEWTAEALRTPQQAARAAYTLTSRYGGFGWSPAWVRGSERPFLAHAAAEAFQPPYQEGDVSEVRTYSAAHEIVALGHRLRRLTHAQ